MSDFIAGPASGTDQRATGSGGSGASPAVLLALLGVALIIAVTLVAFALGSSGGDSPIAPAAGRSDEPLPAATTPATEERVLLTLQIEGGGGGKVRIEPIGVTCTETCEHQFAAGTRVSVAADAADGSRFEGWTDACTGASTCSVFMDRERVITATFEGAATTQCEDERDNDEDGFVDGKDPGCEADNTEAPDDRPEPATDCNDGRDNDSDGLIDTAQDPGCEGDETEADGDESGASEDDPIAPPPLPPPPTTVPGVSQCADGVDNDGDGRIDRPADPGCDADGTEDGER